MALGILNPRVRLWSTVGTWFLVFFFASPVYAHLMVAQKGTLKWGKGGYFFVVSLPVSAVTGIDDDGDGLLSKKELRRHRETIKAAVREGFALESPDKGPLTIEGLLLNSAHHHRQGDRPASHIVAMGRFSAEPDDQGLFLKMNLFGIAKSEQRFEITITRNRKKEVAVVTKEQPSHPLLAGR